VRQPQPVIAAAKRMQTALSAVGKKVVGRKDILAQIIYALVTKNHVLLEGPPGVAKSYLASAVFSCIEGSEFFKVQCTKKMSEDYLVGPLDMRLFREEGEYRHRVEGYLPTADFAFLDEFMDLSTGAMRALLEVLNERTFSRGPQSVRCPLHTAVAATNFSAAQEDGAEAVIDRFLFRAKVQPLADKDRLLMLKAVKSTGNKDCPTFSLEDVRRVHEAVGRVVIPDGVLAVYSDLCGKMKVTDRTAVRALQVIRASAVFSGRAVAVVRDLAALETCFRVSGDASSTQHFAATFGPAYKTALQIAQASVTANSLAVRAKSLYAMAASAKSYAEVEQTALEAREVIAAATHFKLNENAEVMNRALAAAQYVITRADQLFAQESPT
jgi:MoxR-like ATPase